jgi:hypothetical protein
MKRLGAVTAWAVLATTATQAWAQSSRAPAGNQGWISLIIALVLASAALVASLMSSRRGHQD